MRRLGKDLTVLVGTPAIAVYGGATDGFATAQDVRNGMESSGVTEVIVFPFAFAYHTVKHAVYCLAHGVDAIGCLFYWPAELHPYGPEVQPLDIYTGTWFDKDPNEAGSGTDAESGEGN
eukprot:jgi/Undpi1/11746/HiC_scaffold_37.g14041.m1